jgi:predicted  nucleic acid-binding Zn-ribbon protein
MPYKCVHCLKVYPDSANQVIEGCECRSKFFFYIKEEKLKEIEAKKQIEQLELSNIEKEQIEEDIRDIAGMTNQDTPVFLDFESVKVLKPGKYLFDLQKLFSMDKPRVYKLEDGKYIVDLTTILKKPDKAD